MSIQWTIFCCPGETKSAMDRNTFLGGKGFNQSIALAKAGIPVYHAGNAGESAEVSAGNWNSMARMSAS